MIWKPLKLRHIGELLRNSLDERSLDVPGGNRIVSAGSFSGRIGESVPGLFVQAAGRLKPIGLLIGAQSFVEILATMGIDFARRKAGTVKPDLRFEDYRAELAGSKVGGPSRFLDRLLGVSATADWVLFAAAPGSIKTFDNRTGRSAASAIRARPLRAGHR